MEVFYNIDLTPRNTFRMKVRSECLVEYDTPEDLRSLFEDERMAGEFPLPFLHIGGGSNLLFTGDFHGTLLHSRIKFITSSHEGGRCIVKAGAGVPWDDLCLWCCERRLWGAENLSLIPGEVGAAAVQNVGAYGCEAADIIEAVECYDILQHRMVVFPKSQCEYGYRTSVFKGPLKGRYIVVAVTFALTEEYSPKLDYGNVRAQVVSDKGSYAVDEARLDPSDVREAVIKIRRSKLPDPKDLGSAGSFFRNAFVLPEQYAYVQQVATEEGLGEVPHFMSGGLVKIPTAWLIEKCGWKGRSLGNAAVYEKQPLVIVNATSSATPEEILALEKAIIKSVQDKFGIVLYPEVEHI